MWKFVLSIIFRSFQFFLMMFEKKLSRVFATSTSSGVIFSLFTKIIFSLNLILSKGKGVTVQQNFLLSDLCIIDLGNALDKKG